MRKLTAVVLRSDAETVIRRLMWLSCVEVTSPDIESGDSSFDSEYINAERQTGRLDRAIKLLKNYIPKEKRTGLFTRRPYIKQERYDADESVYAAEYGHAERAEEISHRSAEIENEKISLQGDKETLQPWTSCPLPLDLTGTKETRVWFGTLPASTTDGSVWAAISDVPCNVEFISEDSGGKYVTVIFHISGEDAVYAAMASLGFVKLDRREYKGTAAANIARIDNEIKKSDIEAAALEAELYAMAEKIDDLRLAYDAASAMLSVMTAKRKLGETRETVILTGWVPLKATEKVAAQLDKLHCGYEFGEPRAGDEVPILLQNRRVPALFEPVIELYAMPLYGTYDPTVIMSVFYFIIFGLMLGDVVYGLLLAVGGLLAVKLLDLNAGIKRFVGLFAVCGISCIISGIFFGSYLGDLPVVFLDSMLGIKINTPALLFDPVADPMLFLVVSLVAGAAHLIAGMCVKFYILWSSGKPFDALFDIGSWFVLFAGLGILIVNREIGQYVALAGTALIVLTQGRAEKNIFMKLIKGLGALYGIVNYVSDLLSYSRIMALGLATAVIASVVNLLATLPGDSVIGFILMVIILLVGHTVNLVINLLGTFVHTSRLQYIEFFGKFYEDGGKLFKPVRAETKYTHVIQ
jgi:V/A-type H+-transporting ATPase subunit I